MQYILTQQEFDDLAPKIDLDEARQAIELMREMIVGERCIHTSKSDQSFGYCDRCPLSDIGGRAGEPRPNRHLSRAMCDLDRRYSK